MSTIRNVDSKLSREKTESRKCIWTSNVHDSDKTGGMMIGY